MLKTYLLTLLAPLFGAGSALINSEPKSGDFFSKDYTTVLKGLCCIIVVYVHVLESYQNPLQDAIGSFAYICVTLFFLFSAYGMMLSVGKNPNYLQSFWRNRLVALLIPCILISVLIYVLNIILKGINDWTVFYKLNSYVVVLLQWCLLFYLVQWAKNKWFPSNEKLADLLLITPVVLSSFLLYFFVDANVSAQAGWCFERMGLVWGVLLYRYFDGFVRWMNQNRIAKIVGLSIIGGLLGIAYLKYKIVYFWGAFLLKIVLGLSLILLLFVISSGRKFGNKISLGLGNISYEVYLSHGVVMGFFLYLLGDQTIDSGLFIFLSVVITIAVSIIVHYFSNILVKSLRNK